MGRGSRGVDRAALFVFILILILIFIFDCGFEWNEPRL
jgi:hypothetical protein